MVGRILTSVRKGVFFLIMKCTKTGQTTHIATTSLSTVTYRDIRLRDILLVKSAGILPVFHFPFYTRVVRKVRGHPIYN